MSDLQRTLFAAAAMFGLAAVMSVSSPPIWFGAFALPTFFLVVLIWLRDWPEEKP